MARFTSRLARVTATMSVGIGLVISVTASSSASASSVMASPSINVQSIENISQAPGNQMEGSIAIDPSNTQRAFSIGRDEAGNLIEARSTDGGVSWVRQVVGGSILTGGLPSAWGNTSVAFDSFGNLFLVYLSTGAFTYTVFALSSDGGQTWSVTRALNSHTDQPVVSTGPGSVWVTYNRGGLNLVSGASVTGLGAVGSFSSPVVAPVDNGQSFGDIAIGPLGQVAVAFGPNGSAVNESGLVQVAVDPDGLGPQTFGSAVVASTTGISGFTMAPSVPHWGFDSEAHLAWDNSGGPHQGRLYLEYLDAANNDATQSVLMVRWSDDQGLTWSTGIQVSPGAGPTRLLPGFALDQSTGCLAASWYDTGADLTKTSVSYIGSISCDGGATWSSPLAFSAGTTNALGAIPTRPVRMTDLGDYTGLAYSAGILLPVWADNSNSTGDNPDGVGHNLDLFIARATVSTAPQAPSAPEVTVGDRAAVVHWTAPQNLGGSAISGYLVVAQPGGQTCSTVTTSCAVQGLIDGVSTTFTVTASNASGSSFSSPVSPAVTPIGVPTAPTITSLTAGNAQLSVSWSDGEPSGTPITSTLVTVESAGTLLASSRCSASPCTITGLTNGVAVTVYVANTNAVGDGVMSTVEGPVTPATTSDAPQGVTATPAVGSAAVSWTAPASTGGMPITSYIATASPGGATCTTATTMCTIVGLTEGASYVFSVRALTSSGLGSPSTAVSATLLYPAPASVRVVARSHQITGSWAPPPISGGVVKGYVVTLTATNGGASAIIRASARSRMAKFGGLTDLVTYQVTVVALEGAASTPSAPSSPLSATPASSPSSPVLTTLTLGSAAVTISWRRSISEGSLAVTYAVVVTNRSAEVVASIPTSATSATIGGLTRGARLRIQVVASTSATTAGWAALSHSSTRAFTAR